MKVFALAMVLATMAVPAAAQQQLKPGLWEIHQKMSGVPGMGGDGTVTRVCMTQEMAARHGTPPSQGRCKVTSNTRSGNTAKVAFACTNPPSDGETQTTYSGDGAYTMKSVMNFNSNGQSMHTVVEASAKWLQADCGDVKPRTGAN